MFKSKIFFKAMFIVVSTIIVYTLLISFFTVPKVENSFISLEEKNAKDIFKNVIAKVNDTNKELEEFKFNSIQQYKDDLIHLTDTVWSIIQTKYIQSKHENIGNNLKNRALEFKSNLMNFYNNNKNSMSKDELKQSIINYIKIYRYNSGTGYFWINDFTAKMIVHPMTPSLNNTYVGNYKDSNERYLFKEMIDIVQKKDAGLIKYKWLNPKSKKIENKISYVFKFEPFNWVVGTGDYYSVLKQKLQNEVFELVNKAQYSNNNYFFIANYDNVILAHPYLQGRDFSKVKDIKGNLIIPPMVKIARENGNGFYSYWWKKNNNDPTVYEKLSFIKNFPDWKMTIGTGLYLDDIKPLVSKRKKELTDELSKVIINTKLAQSGYIYIFDGKGELVIHPNNDLAKSADFSKIVIPSTNKLIFEELIAASKTKDKSLYYKWDKPNSKGNYDYDKVSWVEYIPKLDWYVVSSVYTQEFKESANDVRNFVLSITLLFLVLFIIYGFVFFRKLLTPIIALSKISSNVSKGDYTKRYTLKHGNDEVGVLAKKFNEMVDTIEFITLELKESNEEFEHMMKSYKEVQTKLVEVEKMASLGGLVAGVAHEINTPVGVGLTGITHFLHISEKIKNDYESENMSQEEFENYLKVSNELATIINLNLDRTARLVKSFKQISIDQTNEEKREFNLKEYINSILLSICNITNKTNLTITVKCDDSLNIDSYPGLFSQIITNLIMNSINHGYDEREKGNININASIDNNTLLFEYKDDGRGITKENMLRIFDPFFTTNRNKGGTGLGLNIVYNIVKNNLKGSIHCTSTEAEGVLFKISVPLPYKIK